MVGRLLPAGPMLLFEMVLLSLSPVEKNTTPPLVASDIVAEPCSDELVTVLLVAPPMKRMVLVVDTSGSMAELDAASLADVKTW